MLHALLMSNLDCFKLFAQVSIVLVCGINLPNRLCPRSEWHIMFSGFYLDIEEVAAPAKCLSPMMYINLKVVCENNSTMRVGSSSNVLIATLREKWMRGVYTVYN